MSLKRISKELASFRQDPPAHCSGDPVSEDMLNWEVFIAGPEDSPYVGGRFRLSVTFPEKYPIRHRKLNSSQKFIIQISIRMVAYL